MAKQKITDKLQAKFNKPQFQIGDAVFFSWLGQKQYGYVTKTKKTNWGIQYTVESDQKRRYPCGLQIEGIKSYEVGFIFLEESKQLGSDECAARINQPRTFTAVSIDTGGQENQSQDDDRGNTTDNGIDIRKTVTRKRSGSSTKNDVKPSSTRVSNNTANTRKNTKSDLDTAIQKQKDFLNGFIKKD